MFGNYGAKLTLSLLSGHKLAPTALTLRNFACLTNRDLPSKAYRNAEDRQLKYNVSSNLISERTITNIPPQNFYTSWFQTLSNSTPVQWMYDTLVDIHDYTGLPWWASIIFSTLIFRTVITLPLTIYQNHITARLENITLKMPALVEEIKREAAIAKQKFQWTEKQTKAVFARSVRKQWNQLIVNENCHPAKTFIVVWSQIPLWIFQSMALRNIVYMQPNPMSVEAQVLYAEMTVGGFGWIPNLTEIDSSYILPISLGLINLSIIELQTRLRKQPSGKFKKAATNVFRVVSIIMVPVACTVPSALCLYWVTSSCYGLVQNILLATPAVRRFFRIPLTKSEIQKPIEYVLNSEAKQLKPNKTNINEVKKPVENVFNANATQEKPKINPNNKLRTRN